MYKYAPQFLSMRHYSFLYKATDEESDTKAERFHLLLQKQNQHFLQLLLLCCESPRSACCRIPPTTVLKKIIIIIKALFSWLYHRFNWCIVQRCAEGKILENINNFNLILSHILSQLEQKKRQIVFNIPKQKQKCVPTTCRQRTLSNQALTQS